MRASLYLNWGWDADGVLDKEIKKETIYTDPQGLGFSGSYCVLGGWGGWDDVPCPADMLHATESILSISMLLALHPHVGIFGPQMVCQWKALT